MWFVDRHGNTAGPVDPGTIQQLIVNGEIDANTLVWQQGWTEWIPAQRIFEGLRRPHAPDPPPPPGGPRQKAASSATEKAVTAAHDTFLSLITTFGPLAAGLATLADFVQPVVSLTKPVTLGSLLAAVFLWLTARAAPVLRARLMTAAQFFLMLFVCSGAWWALQSILPAGQNEGALVEILPGAGLIQESLVKPLARVEEQTKRVGDLLEQQSREQREAEEKSRLEAEAIEKEWLDNARKVIIDAGYTTDAAGYVRAVADGFSEIGRFELLKILPTAPVVSQALTEIDDSAKLFNLTSFIRSNKDRMGFLRPIDAALNSDKDRIEKAFVTGEARNAICAREKYVQPIAVKRLNEICGLPDRKFAVAYRKFNAEVYSNPNFQSYNFSISNPEKINSVKISAQAPFWKLEECEYYEGNYRFVLPFFAIIDARTGESHNFDWWTGAFDNFPQECSTAAGASIGRVPMCHARILIAARCENESPYVVKVLKTLPQ